MADKTQSSDQKTKDNEPQLKTKRKKVTKGPCYKHELSIYKKETQEKIDGFRRARSHWLATADESQKTFTKVKEGIDDLYLYKGRCICLRKLKLKAPLFRYHYKTVRPLRYWTFKKKLADYNIVEEEPETEETQKETEDKLLEQTCSGTKVWKKEDVDECEKEATRLKGRKARKKRKECKAKRATGPCEKAIKRLKAAKIKEGFIESCKCEDGREVTVVIKGICLCDKTSFNNLNLGKVCGEYNKMNLPVEEPTNKTPENITKETRETNTSNQETVRGSEQEIVCEDSSEEEEVKKENGDCEGDTKEGDGKKRIAFDEKNLKGEPTRNLNTQSDLTLYRKGSEGSLKTESDEVEVLPEAVQVTEGTKVQDVKAQDVGKQKTKMQETNTLSKIPETEPLNENEGVNSNKDVEVKADKAPKKEPPKDSPDTSKYEPRLSDSINFHKRIWKKKDVPAKTEQKQPKEEEPADKHLDPEKKTKVKLNTEHNIIGNINFSRENSTLTPKGKAPGLLKTPEVVPSQKSSKESQVLESRPKVATQSAEEVKQDSKTGSTVTLFTNEPAPESEMGLTKEEHERMKEVEKESKREKRSQNRKDSIT